MERDARNAVAARRRVRVLMVEDSAEDRETYRRQLALTPEFDCDVVAAETGGDGLEIVRADTPDVILLDFQLPDMSGLEVLAELTAEGLPPPRPVVMLTGEGHDQVGIDALRLGAQDYLVKQDVSAPLLCRSIRYAIERHALITELRARAERESEMHTQFLSHVSQELAAPLTPISQFLTVLRGGATGALTAKQHEYVSLIHRNIRRLREMIDQLVEAAAMDLGVLEVRPREGSVSEIVNSALVRLLPRAASKDVELAWALSERLPRVLADEGRVQEVVTNLVLNAIKSTPARGRIQVGADACEEDAPPSVRVAVADTGAGVPAEDVERVFDRLYQRTDEDGGDRRGIGLGLYLSREIIVRHGGRIWVEPNVPHGAVFCFTLPCAPKPPARTIP